MRLFILLALMLGTLPAPAAGAPACHDMADMAMPAGHHAPTPEPADTPPAMGKALCVGCIAPATMKVVEVQRRVTAAAHHAMSGAAPPMRSAELTPEPPPPRA